MDQAVNTSVTGIAGHTSKREPKYKGRNMKDPGRYADNLSAIQQAPINSSTIIQTAESSDNLPIVRAGSVQRSATCMQPDEDWVDSYEYAVPPPVSRHRKIAAPILIALASCAVAASIWSTRDPDDPPQTNLHNTSQDFAQDSAIAKQQDKAASLPPPQIRQASESTTESEMLPAIPLTRESANDTESAQLLEDEYLEEIGMLQRLNDTLQMEVDSLNDETVELNDELLKLGMRMDALKSASEPVVETRTVYNFVTVPIGSSVGQDRSKTNAGENRINSNEPTGDSDQQINDDPPSQESYNNSPFKGNVEETMRWDSNDQPVEFIDAYSGDDQSPADITEDPNSAE